LRRDPPGRREVMERDDRIDTSGEQRLAQRAVARDRGGRPLPFLGLDAAPLDRESVVVEPEVTTQRDVVRPAVPGVAAVTARFLATRPGRVLPLPPVVVPVATLDLVRGRGGAPPESVRKARRHR